MFWNVKIFNWKNFKLFSIFTLKKSYVLWKVLWKGEWVKKMKTCLIYLDTKTLSWIILCLRGAVKIKLTYLADMSTREGGNPCPLRKCKFCIVDKNVYEKIKNMYTWRKNLHFFHFFSLGPLLWVIIFVI